MVTNTTTTHACSLNMNIPAFVIGAIIGALSSTVSQVIQNKGFNNFSWGSFGVGTLTGAIGGGIADALPGFLGQSAATSLGGNIAKGALNGALSGSVAGGVGSALRGGNFWNGALGGAIGGGIGGGFGGLLEGNPPESPAEYPAIGHDRRYDRLKVQGASGLFGDTRAIGADYKFVSEQLSLANLKMLHPNYKTQSLGLGLGLGLFALPKTIYQFTKPMNGANLFETMLWYNLSSQGITNKPSR
jgi:hypothetical protein